jgi:DNA-binding NarL/FixJ family response regulator
MGKPPLHLLLVEDEPAHAAAIRHAFETGEAETQIEVVRTLEEFRRHSAGHTPDLALLDLNLPDGKAVEVLSHPPEDGPFPIIVMTSYGSERLAVQAIKSGALDYVVKSPESFADMPHTIARALREWTLLTESRKAVAAQKKLIAQLEEALSKVKTLSGLLPICSGCNKIRDDHGYWSQVEGYIQEHTDAQFTHGLCPDCIRKYFPEMEAENPPPTSSIKPQPKK